MSKYWISMVLLFVVLAGGGWWFVSHQQQSRLEAAMKGEKERIAEYLRGKAVGVLSKEIFQSKSFEEQDAVFSKYWASIQSPEYVRIKIWNDNYTLVWADMKESIGQRFPDNHEMEEALEGEIELEIESLEGSENESERQFFKTSEVYVPLYGEQGKEIIGVVEVYKTAYFIDQAKQAGTKIAIYTAFILLTLYAVLGIFLHRFFRKSESSQMSA